MMINEIPFREFSPSRSYIGKELKDYKEGVSFKKIFTFEYDFLVIFCLYFWNFI